MTNIIVLFSKIEEGRSIRSLLVKRGYDVATVCTTGAQALTAAADLPEGIVICGYRYKDMLYSELAELLPQYFEMLLMVPERLQSECAGRGIVCLTMPLKVHDFVSTVEMMVTGVERRRRRRRQQKPRPRSEDEKRLIDEAKKLLMERNNLSEAEAHRYLQKCSMDSGTNMIETAQMVLSMF